MDEIELTTEQLRVRIHTLVSEIDANEEENRMFKEELDSLYQELDKRKERLNG